MAITQITHLSLTGLQKYDEKIKAFIASTVAAGDEKSFKYVDLVDGVLKFYTVNPIDGAEPVFEIELPEQDLSHLMTLVEGAIEGSYEKVLHAFALNKTVPSIEVAKEVLDEMMIVNKPYWPELK